MIRSAPLGTNPGISYAVIGLLNYDLPAAGLVARKINSFLERLK